MPFNIQENNLTVVFKLWFYLAPETFKMENTNVVLTQVPALSKTPPCMYVKFTLMAKP